MRRRDFHRLVEALRTLSPHQLRQLEETVGGLVQQTKLRTLVSERVAGSGRCPHCGSSEFRRWGRTASGEQRYRCKKCARSFTGLTGTGLCRLRHKRLLPEYAQCMKAGMSVRATAKQLGVHRNVVFRWRHRLMPQLATHQPRTLQGVAEADEAFFRESFKGRKGGLPRKAYKRGMPASKRGLSREQIPVLTAVARGSRSSFISVLPGVTSASSVTSALAPVLAKDAVLVSDSAAAYRLAARELGVVGRQIPRGEHKLGPYHIQNVNALHSRMKAWFKPFKGVASRYLPSYLAWFRFFDESGGERASVELLADAIFRPHPSSLTPA